MKKLDTVQRGNVEELLFNSQHLTHKDITNATGIPLPTIANWRNGNRNYLSMTFRRALVLSHAYTKFTGKDEID